MTTPPANALPTHAPPKILVVEDEKAIRRFVRMSLEIEGFEVFEAEGVKRGLIEAGTRHPDMVVLDLGPVSYTHLTLPTNREV